MTITPLFGLFAPFNGITAGGGGEEPGDPTTIPDPILGPLPGGSEFVVMASMLGVSYSPLNYWRHPK